MASVVKEANGRRLIQINELPNRPKVRLGKASDKVAHSIRVRIEAVIAAKASGQPLDHDTAAWLGQIDGRIHEKLAALGLIHPRGDARDAATLSQVLDRYIGGRSRIKPNTLRNYKTTRRLLEEHFGAARPVASIHAGQARDYRESLVGKYASATVAREIKRARQFFEYAKDSRLLTDNPFAKVKAGSQKNTSRKHFVDRATIDQVLEACPTNEWRLIVALARYGGLRIPSELTDLTWDRVDWLNGRFTVSVPKKEHLDGHGERTIPIFPELRPYLEEAFNQAPVGNRRVIGQVQNTNINLRTGLQRILRKASVAQWPKLFQNLRASRETELMREHPAHVVYAWLGNSREVAQDHYLTVTEADFVRASTPTMASDPIRQAVQKAVHSATVTSNQGLSPENESAVSPAFARDTAVLIPPRGVEPRFSD